MSTKITDTIIAIIAENLDLPVEAIKPTSNFTDDLKADSLAVTEVGLEVESAFDVVIEDEAMNTVKTVQDLIDYVSTRFEQG